MRSKEVSAQKQSRSIFGQQTFRDILVTAFTKKSDFGSSTV